MIVMVTEETILVDLTLRMRSTLASAFRIPESMVTIQWDNLKDGTLAPRLELALPPAIPPSDINVEDPAAMAAWEEEARALPGITDFLQARGIADPEAWARPYMAKLVADLKKRFEACRA